MAQYAVPTAGQTISANNATQQLLLEPAGTLATLTVNLPASPIDGQICSITSSQIITALTLGAGANSIVAAITALVLGGTATYIYRASNTSWYKCG